MRIVVLAIFTSISFILSAQSTQISKVFPAFKELHLDGRMTVVFHKSDSVRFDVSLLNISDDFIYTKFKDSSLLFRVEPISIENSKITVNIYSPKFNALRVSRLTKVYNSELVIDKNTVVDVVNGGEMYFKNNVERLNLNISKKSFVEISGSVDSLFCNVKYSSQLRVDNGVINFANIMANVNSYVVFNKINVLKCKVKWWSNIVLSDKPTHLYVKTSLKGKVIKQY